MTNQFSHLKKLSAMRSGKNIKFFTPAVYSGGWCPMRGACNIVEGIEGLSYLMVCMPECATHSRSLNSLPEGPHGEKRWLYVLDANEVIFGCREGVMEALRTMDREGAKAILMIATCVTDLIGEDFEGMIHEVQPELHAKLTYVTLGQFKNFGTPMGTAKVGTALAALVKPCFRRREKLVNVLFIEAWRAKGSPVKFPLIVKALEERGISVRRLTSDASLEDYENAGDAAFNLVISAYMEPMASALEEKTGQPALPLHNAFRVEEIDRAYRELEERLGISLEGAFDGWRKKALELEERARRELKGKKFVTMVEVDMPLALTEYLSSLGMEPLLVDVEDVLPEDLMWKKKLNEAGIDPPVCHIMNLDQDVLAVRDQLKPDIAFSYLNEPVPGLPVAEQMTDFFGITGYERTVGILRRIFAVLETGKMEEGGFDLYGPAPI